MSTRACITAILAAALLTSTVGSVTAAPSVENRALWAYAWGRGFKSSAEVADLVNRAKSGRFNVIAAEVRKVGDAYYIPTRPNCDPRASDIPEGYDPLDDLISQAHAQGIKVYAWVVVYRVATEIPGDPEHMYNRHPEWLCMQISGGTSFGEGYYMDPGVPGVAEWNFNVCMDLVNHYSLDGMILDIVRYPQQNSGYNPIALQRFRERYGLAPTYVPNYNDNLFSAWRREQVTQFVRKVYASMLSVKPEMVLAASTISDRNDAFTYRFQDWRAWMMSGFLDANCPMVYTATNSIFNSRVGDAVSNSGGRHVYPIQGSYLNTIANSMTQLTSTRTFGANGQGVYRYCFTHNGDTNTDLDDEPSFYSSLISQIYTNTVPTPPMSWKTAPTVGHVKGRVIDAVSGKPVDAAWVTVEPLGLGTYGDGTGFYAHMNLAPGDYVVTVSKTGYAMQTKPVTITAGTVQTVDFVFSGEELTGIAQTKQRSDGNGVALKSVVVTAGNSQLQRRVYVEDNDRTSGVLLQFTADIDEAVEPGDVVSVYGPMGTSANGERQITNPVVFVESTGGAAPGAIDMRQRDMGGEALGTYTPGVVNGRGPNNIGLLIETVGKVVDVDSTNGYFYVDDGSNANDYSGPMGIRVICSELADGNTIVLPPEDSYVRLTGISSVVRLAGSPYRALRLRTQNDWRYDPCSNVTVPQGVIVPGWNLVGFPRSPKYPSPPAVFGAMPVDNTLYRWENWSQSLVPYDSWSPENFGNILRGSGYWFTTAEVSGISIPAFSTSGDFRISLARSGWSMIGSPFPASEAWSDVLVTNAVETVSISDAARLRGWMSSTGWWWDSSSQSLRDMGLPDEFPSTSMLDPWHGYWIQSSVDGLALIVQNH